MRPLVFALLLCVGCGSVRLGEAEPEPSRDFDAANGLDGGPDALKVVVTIGTPDAGCGGCVELAVRPDDGTPPYSYEWKDGNRLQSRTVCTSDGVDSYEVLVRDAQGRTSAAQTVRLDLAAETCVDASVPLLCVKNGSFEGKVQVNGGGQFDAPPWNDCTQPSRFNTPHVTNASIPQWVTDIPEPTDGRTFVGLQEDMQVSQTLCEPLLPGDVRYFHIDARKLDISTATLVNSEQIFLSVWGGTSANCRLNQQLWMQAQPLDEEWQTLCVPVKPQQYMDQLTLWARTDESQGAFSVMVVDNLVPVSSCP
jgi:hypothetical protein